MFIMTSSKLSKLCSAEEALQNTYEEIQADLNLFYYGQEGFISDAGAATLTGLVKVSKKMGALILQLVHSIRNAAEKTFLRYSKINQLWKKRIEQNQQYINSEKFGLRKISIVDYDDLIARLETVTALHHLLDNFEQICNSPVSSDGNWKTSQFQKAYDLLLKIGFDTPKFNLVKKTSAAYDAKTYSATIDTHGYTSDKLDEIVRKLDIVAKYSESKTLSQLEKRFIQYGESLSKFENSLREQDGDDITEQREVLEIRISRFWWCTHFIKVSHQVAHDVMIDVLKLCKVAESKIEKD